MQTGSAVNERQKMTMTSLTQPETQNISFADWKEQVSVNEVQTVEVTQAADQHSDFRLGMDGAFTGKHFRLIKWYVYNAVGYVPCIRFLCVQEQVSYCAYSSSRYHTELGGKQGQLQLVY